MNRISTVSSATTATNPSTAMTIVVVDPRFETYKALATAAKLGRCHLYFRWSAAAALDLQAKRQVDAWIVGEELDDMAGHDFVALLRSRQPAAQAGGRTPVVLIAAATGGGPSVAVEHEGLAAGADATLSQPITLRDVEDRIDMRSGRRTEAGRAPALVRAMATLPVGVGAAAIAIATLLLR